MVILQTPFPFNCPRSLCMTPMRDIQQSGTMYKNSGNDSGPRGLDIIWFDKWHRPIFPPTNAIKEASSWLKSDGDSGFYP